MPWSSSGTFLEWYRADLFRLYEGRFFIANRDEMTRIHHSHNPTVIWPAWSGFYEGPEEPEFSEEMLAGPVASSGF